MGRTPGAKNKKKPSSDVAKNFQRLTRDPKPKKTCPACQKEKSLPSFYKSFNQDLHKDGYLPYCKDCLIDMSIDPETHGIDFERFQNVLRQCDRPWDEDALMGSVRECERDYNSELDTEEKSKIVIAKYWKTVQSLPQYRMSWQEYEDKKRIQSVASTGADTTSINQSNVAHEPIDEDDAPIFFDDDKDDFKVTNEMLHRWGDGYTRKEYKAFEEKYQFLSQSYANYSALHQEALLNYCRFKVKEELATRAGNVDAASSWSTLATKAATNAKINPSQITEETDGGFSFSEFNASIERASDVIRILPQFKAEAQDSVDFCIYVYVNYVAAMMGKPPIEYSDVYKFYDDAVESYKAQYGDVYGIFKAQNNPTKKNRKAVEKFIDVPKESQASFYSGSD